MDQKQLTDQLQKMFASHESAVPSAQSIRRGKLQLLQKIEQIEKEQVEQQMLSQLRKYYHGYNEVQKSHVKQLVLQQIREEQMLSWSSSAYHFLFGFSRKALAMSFAFLLVFTTFLGPFQTLQPLRMVNLTQAAYLECRGKVYLNGQLCTAQSLIEVAAGDEIKTDTDSLATLFYSDYTIVRLNDSSRASLDAKDRSQIHLAEGNVWLHSPGEVGLGSFKVDTSVLRAKLPQGAAGISARGMMTQLYTTTSAVEVQIENAPGATQLMTIAPEKQLLIRKSRNNARVQETSLVDRAPEWVKNNQQKDIEYLQLVKQKTLESTIAGAGVLPGSFQDYVQKITQSARTVLTWDQSTRLHHQLTELDELFSEALVLLGKGDITTAESTFKAYQQKFTSLVAQKSDTIRLEISAAETDSFGKLLQYHARIVSPFSPEDEQYVLKQAVEQLALELVRNGGNELARRIVAEAVTNKLLLAHQAIAQGHEGLAEELLLETAEFVHRALPYVPLAIDTSDLSMLNSLASKSNQLVSMVRDIKRLKVEQLRSLTPQNQTPAILASYVAGTAYKPLDTVEQTEVKVVGQAVKEEDAL